jgi:hypothetical protein
MRQQWHVVLGMAVSALGNAAAPYACLTPGAHPPDKPSSVPGRRRCNSSTSRRLGRPCERELEIVQLSHSPIVPSVHDGRAVPDANSRSRRRPPPIAGGAFPNGWRIFTWACSWRKGKRRKSSWRRGISTPRSLRLTACCRRCILFFVSSGTGPSTAVQPPQRPHLRTNQTFTKCVRIA